MKSRYSARAIRATFLNLGPIHSILRYNTYITFQSPDDDTVAMNGAWFLQIDHGTCIESHWSASEIRKSQERRRSHETRRHDKARRRRKRRERGRAEWREAEISFDKRRRSKEKRFDIERSGGIRLEYLLRGRRFDILLRSEHFCRVNRLGQNGWLLRGHDKLLSNDGLVCVLLLPAGHDATSSRLLWNFAGIRGSARRCHEFELFGTVHFLLLLGIPTVLDVVVCTMRHALCNLAPPIQWRNSNTLR